MHGAPPTVSEQLNGRSEVPPQRRLRATPVEDRTMFVSGSLRARHAGEPVEQNAVPGPIKRSGRIDRAARGIWAGVGEGTWIGVVTGGAGILFALLVLARGGEYLTVVHDLRWLVPLVVVGVVTALAAGRLGAGRANAVVWLLVVTLAAFGWNFLVYAQRLGRGAFGLLLPLVHPTGIDWRVGIYAAGRSFTNAESGYPPFTLWIGKAFALVGPSAGYAIQVCLLGAFALGSAALCALLARCWLLDAGQSEAGESAGSSESRRSRRQLHPWQLGLAGGLWLVTSYGFMFEIERGQLDLYALFFALLAVWLVLRRPQGSPWWPSIALAAAVNIKAFPALLAVVLLWRYRWRAVVPLLATNAALLLSAGPANVGRFFARRAALEESSFSRGWVNDSAASLAHTLHEVSSWPASLWIVFLAVSVLLWMATLAVVMRRKWSARGAVLASAACVPVMCTLPSISNDYRLVLLVFPLSVLATATAGLRNDGGPLWALLFLAVGSEFFLLARSSRLIAPSLQGSKFALIVGLQVLLLIVGVLEGRAQETRSLERSAPAGRAGSGVGRGDREAAPDAAGRAGAQP
jgi:hypothetical protein